MDDSDSVGTSRVICALLGMAPPLAAVTFIIGIMIVALPRPASAKPEFAAKTGFQCGQCHVSPGGGGKLKPFGEAFKANDFKVPKKKK